MSKKQYTVRLTKEINGKTSIHFDKTYKEALLPLLNKRWLSSRAFSSDIIFELSKLGAPFSVLSNTDTLLHIHAVGNTDKVDEVFDKLQTTTLLSNVETKETLDLKLRSELVRIENISEVIPKVLDVMTAQANTYGYLFIDSHRENALGYVMYLDRSISLDLNRVAARAIKPLSAVAFLDVPERLMNGLSLTVIDTDLSDIESLLGYAVEIYNTLAETDGVEPKQGEEGEDNPELINDIILETGKLYKYRNDDLHSHEVVKHSILHHQLPFVLLNSVPTEYDTSYDVYCYIGNDVDKRLSVYRDTLKTYGYELGLTSVKSADTTVINGYVLASVTQIDGYFLDEVKKIVTGL